MNRLELFPDTTRVEHDSLTVGGCDLAALAQEFGTPLYLYDRSTLDASVSAYRNALGRDYPGRGSLTYAGKAYLSLAMAEWTQRQGLRLDCSGLGEIAIAVEAGVPAANLLVHGVNKSAADLEAALAHAGTIVVDNLAELGHLISVTKQNPFPDLWLRLQPGVPVATHAHIQTGQKESKFGMPAEEILRAAQACRENRLPLTGIHFHLGSQLRYPDPVVAAIGKALDLVREIGFEREWVLCPGGGWGVAYREDEPACPGVEEYVGRVAEAVTAGCRDRGLTLPHLALEPGRSLAARAGVAVYRVGAVKYAGRRTWILLDGGLADNPRPALYAARYSALPVRSPERAAEAPVWMAGPYCESGDVLIQDLPFPAVGEGDLVAVPVSGAYQLSMAGNYNGARRPAVVWLEGGQARLIQERESPADLFRRDRRLAK